MVSFFVAGKFFVVLTENMTASNNAHAALAVSGSTASTGLSAALRMPDNTLCASAQKGCACVRSAKRPVTSGAHHKSVVVQPYARSSGGVCRDSGVGLRKENMFVRKKPPFAVI